MRVRQECQDGICLLAVSGPVAEDAADQLVSDVRTALVDQPLGVVVDLHRATRLSGPVVSALRAVWAETDGRSRARVVFCAVDAALVARLGPAPVYGDCVGAVAHLAALGDPHGERVDLRYGLDGPAQARAVVAAWSQRLGLDDVTDDMTLIVSEMVTNAVKHASPPVALEISTDGERVLIAVRDGSPAQPQPREADTESEGGRGLLLVDLLCEDHGVRPEPPGKTVWAALTRRRTARP